MVKEFLPSCWHPKSSVVGCHRNDSKKYLNDSLDTKIVSFGSSIALSKKLFLTESLQIPPLKSHGWQAVLRYDFLPRKFLHFSNLLTSFLLNVHIELKQQRL